MRQKGIKLALIFTIVWATIPVLHAEEIEKNFSDLNSGDPYQTAITELKEKGVIEGYSDGTFRSLDKINRAEFLKIIMGSLTETPTGSNCFSDVQDQWFAPFVCEAKTRGVIEGYSDGSFKPGDNINFAEASKVIAKAFELEQSSTSTDENWYKPFIKAVAQKKAIPNSISGSDKNVFRGEVAEMIWRVNENPEVRDYLEYEEVEGVPVQIKSCQDLKEQFVEWMQNYYPPTINTPFGSVVEEDEDDFQAESTPAPTAESATSTDYSSTNVQVEGVDEADVLKNDGQNIYTIKDSKVWIVQAYPPEEMKTIGQIEFNTSLFYPTDLYLDGDHLSVIGLAYNQSFEEEKNDDMESMIWAPYHYARTGLYTYDISNPEDPILKRQLEFDGTYSSSRKVGDTLYLILNKYDFSSYYGYGIEPESVEMENLLPRYYDSNTDEDKPLVDCEDISYFPRERMLNYLMAVAVPMDLEGEITSEVMIGQSENLYASQKNLYVAATNYENDDYYYDWNNAKTVVHRFALEPKKIEYAGRGKVPGTILNQFSMDESENHFRIATTVGNLWDTQNPSKNNLYILNMDMEQVGAIENIAPGEKIYSTRFMGDRGYMVTFKETDPFFVFDLSDPQNPYIAGELKIPGYSNYLQAYDENHIIGFGKDAEDGTEETQKAAEEMNFAWYQGMKIGLFDVTDPSNPKQLFSVGIGDRGTSSQILYNHKALLLDPEKNLLAFPITVSKIEDKENASPDTYGETDFVGAYVYTVDLENGFTLRGTVTHFDEENDVEDYWTWYNYGKEIQRLLYMDDHLYSVSNDMIKSNDSTTLEEENALELIEE